METPILKRSYLEQTNNFIDVGFGRKAEGLNPRLSHLAQGAKFTADEKNKLKAHNASPEETEIIKELLPFRVMMQNSLKRKGLPVPPDIIDLAKSFYEHEIKTSKIGKQLSYIEGNPVLYKLHADANVISATLGIVPAASSYVKYAITTNDPSLDNQLINDAQDIIDYINAKSAGIPVENTVVGQQYSVNPWLIIGLIILVIIVFRKK